MAIEVVEKAVSETFPIGLTYISPDLATGETILGTTTVAVTPTGLTLGAVTVTSPEVSAFISGGTAGVEYVVLFKTVTSGGKTFNNPNKDALRVRVI